MTFVRPVDPEAACGGRARVVCPQCSRRASVAPFNQEVRCICLNCGYVRTLAAWPEGARLHFRDALGVVRNRDLTLWFTTSCGPHELWALDEAHIKYSLAFVESRNRSRDFPSVPGHRQLADKFPAWMSSTKHREHVAQALRRMLAEGFVPQ